MFSHGLRKIVARAASFAFALCLMQAAASAASLTWYYSATLDDGGSVTGQFNYDADLANNQLSAYSISVTDQAFGNFTYNPGNSGLTIATLTEFIFSENGANRGYTIFLGSQLTDAGGTATTTSSSNDYLNPNIHFATSQSLSTTAPTPEPGTIVLTLTAGAVVFFNRRRLISPKRF